MLELTQTETAWMMLGMLFALLLIGLPIALALTASGLAGLLAARGAAAFEFIASSYPYSATANLAYIIIPLFLFMGHMAFAGGLSARAFEAARRLVGQFSGGLAIASVVASAAFATVCGSSAATAATMSKVAIPEMLNAGYNARLASGCIAAAGTLGVLIPPSGLLVIYAIVTGVSISDLLIAAVIPGFFTAFVYAVGIHVICRLGYGGQTRAVERYTMRERIAGIAYGWEAGVLFLVVMGTIYLGVGTPTEAAGIGALMALIIALWRYGRGRAGMLWTGLRETGSATAAIFALIIGSGFFGLGLATTQVPQHAAEWIGSLGFSPVTLLILILLPYLLLGAFVDGVSLVLLTMPIVFPIITDAGINPILFGILITKMVEIGAMTPPVGINVFVVRSMVPTIPLSEIYKGTSPFVFMELIIVGILIAFPVITLGPLGR